MYSTCIFCSAALGRNEALEDFPVGRRVAFDAWKGRLWALCPRCGRWNLAPIEERWEAVEAAEKRFRGARLRAQSENIGLARLSDGTGLIRIGDALPGEFAAWRYGRQLARRRVRYLVGGVGATAAGAALLAGLGTVAGGVVFLLLIGESAAQIIGTNLRERRVIERLPPADSPTGWSLTLRVSRLERARLAPASTGDVALVIPAGPESRASFGIPVGERLPELRFEGERAERMLGRLMTLINKRGAGRRRLDDALARLDEAGDRGAYLRAMAADGADVGSALATVPLLELVPGMVSLRPTRRRGRAHSSRVPADRLLALEMALNEETERRALHGELAALRAAWREAEEIAAIADKL